MQVAPGDCGHTYDADGNQSRKESPSELTDYAWDETGKMTLAQPPAGDVSFTYNAQGQRIEKETPTEVRRFLYDFQRLYQERDADDGPLREYTFGPDNYEENPAGYGDSVSEYEFEQRQACPGHLLCGHETGFGMGVKANRIGLLLRCDPLHESGSIDNA
jgi:YD repeat-containing protein